MTDKPTNKRTLSILITGVSSGIGEACAVEMLRRGWCVFLGVRNLEDAKTLVDQFGDRAIPIKMDVTDQEQISNAARLVEQVLGDKGLDGLINNAGIAVSGPFEFVAIEDVRKQHEVNFIGQVAVTQTFLPYVRKARGRIINIGSISGRVAMPFLGPYSSAKHALEAFSDSLRVELRRWQIPVIVIDAGAIHTPIWEKSLMAANERISRYPTEAFQLYGQDFKRIIDNTARTGAHGIPVEKLAKLVGDILINRRPKARYNIGRGVGLSVLFGKFAPTVLRDWVIARFTGFDR